MRLRISPLEMINSAAKINIIKHLMKYETPMSEREIASVIQMPHTSVNRTLKELALYNLVSYSVAGSTHLWKLNKKSYGYAALSPCINTIYALKSPLENLKILILKGLPPALVKRVVLYGSVAKGTEEPNSDIDLFILVANEMLKKKVRNIVDELSNKCLDAYGNRLEAYILTEKERDHKKDLGVLHEVDKGIQIYP